MREVSARKPRRVVAARDRVTVDLRGLGARLQAQAARRHLTAAALVRRAVVAALEEETGQEEEIRLEAPGARQVVKVTVRMSALHASLLAHRSREADVSQGSYVAGLVEGMPIPPKAPDHEQAVAALMASTDRLAAMSGDLNAVMRELRSLSKADLDAYRDNVGSLVVEIRHHLASASALVSSLRATRGRR